MNKSRLARLQLNPMTAADIPQVIEIELSAYAQPWTETIFHDCLRVGYSCWVLKESDEQPLIGYLILSIAADEMHILNLCIRPEKQGQELGKHLLQETIKLGKEVHAETCFLEVRPTNTSGIRLYLNAGFERIGLRKDYYRGKNKREDAIVMEKKLIDALG